MATDEASLLAALMRGEPVTLARGTVIRLTRTLLICTEEPKWDTGAFYRKANYHCECSRIYPQGRRLRGERQWEG